MPKNKSNAKTRPLVESKKFKVSNSQSSLSSETLNQQNLQPHSSSKIEIKKMKMTNKDNTNDNNNNDIIDDNITNDNIDDNNNNNDKNENDNNNDNDFNINDFSDMEYIKNFKSNEYVKKTILTLLVKFSNPIGSKNIIYKYLFTDGHDVIELVEFNSTMFNKFEEKNSICIKNILVSTKSQIENYDFQTNDFNSILISNNKTIAYTVSFDSTFIQRPFYLKELTSIYDIAISNYENKKLINIKCIIYGLRTTTAKNKQLTTFKAIDTTSKLYIEAQFWNYSGNIVNNATSEISFCILNNKSGKILNNDWPTKVEYISDISIDPEEMTLFNNISLDNIKYITASNFYQIYSNKISNEFALIGNKFKKLI
jgi:hypothetical protein